MIRKLEKIVGKLKKTHNPYFLYGQDYYNENTDISFGINELTGGYYAVVDINIGDNQFYKSMPKGFGYRTITEARKALSGLKKEMLEKVLKELS